MLKGGCWIFLSHHSQDIEKVRLIRNEFERLGHNPLAFHLKCLTTDTESGRKELDNLIKREIDAREWFVFCENPYAEYSEWVDMEQAYIIDSGKEMVWSLDMTMDIENILNKIHKICKDIEVYISYTRQDKEIADILIDMLVEKDYSVWTPELNTKVGEFLENSIGNAIARCSYEGFFIILITENSMNSEWIENEIGIAMQYSGGETIIPILVGNVKMPERYEGWWQHYHVVPDNPCKEDFMPVLKEMEATLKYYISGKREHT